MDLSIEQELSWIQYLSLYRNSTDQEKELILSFMFNSWKAHEALAKAYLNGQKIPDNGNFEQVIEML